MIWCGQGWSIVEQIQLNAGGFMGTESLLATIYPAGAAPDSRLPIAPACTWISGPSGTVSYPLTTVLSTLIPVGHYKTTVAAMVGSEMIGLVVDDLYIYPTGHASGIPSPTSVTGSTATTLALIPTLYCTDEDIAKKCVSDFAALIPPSAVLAAGTDGIFGQADPWTLSSNSNDFAAQGVAVGNVVQLRRPASVFPGQGQLMAVAAVNGQSVTLRHLGMPTNRGRAPSPSSGMMGVDFLFGTFGPQIEEGTYDLNQLYNIDDSMAGRRVVDLRDLRPLRRACVDMVLIDRYSDESRASVGNYADKLATLVNDLSGLKSGLELRWLNQIGNSTTTNWFSTRIVR